MTPRQKEAVEALKLHGDISRAAEALGISRSGLQGLLRNAGYGAAERVQHLKGLSRNVALANLDPAIAESMGAVGTGLVPGLVWAKTKSEDGTSFSVLLKPPQDAPEDTAERIRAALEGMQPAEPVVAPEAVMADLCTVWPVMDMHLGMKAWSKETGAEDYDLALAAQDMRHAFAKVIAMTPASKRGVLLIGGDFFHSDDSRAETPASKHKLDVDGRFFKVLDVGVTILAETIDRLLAKHGEVVIRTLRGNHDPHSHLVLVFALAERYRNEPRVTVEKDPRDLFMMQWGRCAVFAHHGDKGKPQQMALYLSDVCPFWSETRHRFYLTGHVHHDQAKDIGPLRWESLRAFCPPDSYSASMGYGGRRALQSLTFHSQDGLVLRALDPIERQ